MSSSSSNLRNFLLRSLPASDLDLLLPSCEVVTLNLRDVLVERNTPIEYVYFIEHGMGSVVSAPEDGRGVEVSCIGREGMTGIPILLDLERTPLQTFVQVEGSALRVPTAAFRDALEESTSLRKKLLRYSHTVTLQAVEAAHSLGHYTIPQRLARWILLAHDRANDDNIYLTHDFLSLMLGVRRSGVTNAVAVLEGEGMIRGMRGRIRVRDRAALIGRAAGCYGRSEAEYERVISAA